MMMVSYYQCKSPIIIALFSCTFLTLAFSSCPNYPLPVGSEYVSNNPIVQKSLALLGTFLSTQISDQIPGLMATVVYNQNTVFSNAYGKVDPFNNNSLPLTTSHVVEIASITKVFTDLMLFHLRDRGVVDLDDPLDKYLTKFSIKDPYTTSRKVTFRELASHTSGLPREVPCNWMAQLENCTEDDVLKNLSSMYLIHPFYTRPHYSNLGLALLGRGLEKAAGVPYEDYVEKNILAPLNMTRSGFDYTRLTPFIPIGLTSYQNGTAVAAPLERLGWSTPMGGMLASGDDMAKFIKFMFRENNIPGADQPLDGSTLLEAMSPIILTRDAQSAFGSPWEYHYDTDNNIYLRSKAGELLGFRSQVTIVPELKLGIFISCTADYLPTDDTLSAYTFPALSQYLIPAFTQALWETQPPFPFPSNWKTFIGTYRLSDGPFNSLDFEVYTENNFSTLVGAYVYGDQTFDQVNFTEQIDPTTFRVNLVDTDDISCRWLDDGEDQEFIYFTVDTSGNFCSQVVVMGQVYNFLTTDCLDCM